MKEPPVVTPLDVKAPGSKTTGLKIPEGRPPMCKGTERKAPECKNT